MKEKVISFFKDTYKDIIAVLVIILMTTALLIHFYGLHNMDMSVPFGYDGTDAMSSLVEAKMTQETGWNLYTDKLAAPIGFDNSNNIITGLHNTDQLMVKLYTLVTGDYVKGVNFTFLTTFYLIGIISYFVLRQLDLRRFISVMGAMTYSFLPFIFFRNVEHLVLSSYYFIPLLVLICIWIYEDDRFLVFDRTFFHYKKNIAAIIFTALIANSGIVYWQFLGCFFLVVTALVNALRSGRLRCIRQSAVCIVLIIVFMLIGCMPEIIGIIGGSSGTAGRLRSMYDAESYSLKIIQLIMPVRSHGITYLENIIQEYNNDAPLVNENASAYLGIIGVIGFFILLIMLFKRKTDKHESIEYSRIVALSELNICAVLFGTIGGFGTVFFVFISQTLRGFNRISVYIAFFCITTVCIIFNVVLDKLIKKTDDKRIHAAYITAVILFMLFGIWEQNPHIDIPYIHNYEQWTSDDNFVKSIENDVEEYTLIFQLPYQEYPESEGHNLMKSQEPFAGYLHSVTLRWSFGVNKEQPEAEWYKDVSELEVSDMVTQLKAKDFGGIYIDRYGYEDGASKLEKELSEYLGKTPMVSDDGRYVFYKLA